MHAPLPILAESDNYGALIFGLIAFGVWIIKAISSGVKSAKTAGPPRARPVVSGVRAIPSTTPAATPAFHGGRSQTIGAFRKPVPRAGTKVTPPSLPVPKRPVEAPLPPPPPVALAAVKRPATVGRKVLRNDVATALRQRLIWAEILGKPIALRDDPSSTR